MTGTQTPQKLFGDMPTQTFPGQVTPNITAAMPQYTDWGDIANVMSVANQQKEQSRASWARADAQRAAQQRQQQQAGEQEKLRAAFNEWWAPKIQAQSHDRAFALDNKRGEQLRKQYQNVDYFHSGRPFEEGKVPYMGVSGDQLQQQLDQMWRQQTDPYLRAVSGMDAATMFDLGTPGKGGNMPSRRGRGGGVYNAGGGGGASGGFSAGYQAPAPEYQMFSGR